MPRGCVLMDADGDLPDGSNFFASLTTTRSKAAVAALFAAEGWSQRHCSWHDLEVRCPWAELVIDAGDRIGLHGPVADARSRAPQILRLLRAAGIGYAAELYGDDPSEILQTFAWYPGPERP